MSLYACAIFMQAGSMYVQLHSNKLNDPQSMRIWRVLTLFWSPFNIHLLATTQQ